MNRRGPTPVQGCALMWVQRIVTFEPRPRGIHLVTGEVLEALPELGDFGVGILHLLIQHTSASPTLNETHRRKCAPTSTRARPRGAGRPRRYWTHTLEGDAHARPREGGVDGTVPDPAAA